LLVFVAALINHSASHVYIAINSWNWWSYIQGSKAKEERREFKVYRPTLTEFDAIR